MQKAKEFIRKYKWIVLVLQMTVCFLVFLTIHATQRGINEIDLADAVLRGGYMLEDGGVHIDESDGAYGLYLDVDTEKIKKGWYKVHVEYETGYDDNGFLIKPLNGNPNAINRDVGEELETIILKSQHREKSVHVWAKEATGLRISFHFCGGGYLDVKGIKLERVADYTVLFFVLFLFTVVDLMVWEAANTDPAEQRRRYFVRGGIIFITAAASIPLMNGYILMGNDMMFHLFRIEGIAEGLKAGQFPVRIMPQWWNEYGYGASMFYGDVLLYFPAILLLLNYKLQTAFKCYIAAINLLTAWIAYRSFLKMGKNVKIALFGSAIYSLNLFRIMNLYYNNGLGAYTAMAFLPLVIAGLYCIKEKDGWLYLAFGMTGCIQSHLMSCEMTGIFIILLLLVEIKQVCQKSAFYNLCKAGIVVLLWNLWFLVPLLNLYPGDYKLKQMENFQTDIQQNGRNFTDWIYAVIASLNGETNVGRLGTFIGITAVCGLVFAFITAVATMKMDSKGVKHVGRGVGIFGGVSAIALFLSTRYFPYDFLCTKSDILATLIHSLQFPFRFLEMASIFAVAAIVLGLTIWNKAGYKNVCVIVAGVLGGICLIESSFYYQRLLIESPQMTKIDEYYALPESIGTIEYLPAAAEEFYAKQQVMVSGDKIEIGSYEKEYTTIQISCMNDSGQEGYIDVPLFFYPCYKAKDVETGSVLGLTYGENAKIRMILPPGYQGTVKLEVDERKLWKIADLISVVSIFVFFIVFISRKCIMDKKNKEQRDVR